MLTICPVLLPYIVKSPRSHNKAHRRRQYKQYGKAARHRYCFFWIFDYMTRILTVCRFSCRCNTAAVFGGRPIGLSVTSRMTVWLGGVMDKIGVKNRCSPYAARLYARSKPLNTKNAFFAAQNRSGKMAPKRANNATDVCPVTSVLAAGKS